MTKEQQEILAKIKSHLAELHHEWQNDPNSDGYHKSSEGFISVQFNYPNWFECENKEEYINSKPTISISVFSYLFGPYRMHDFDSLEEAWEAIKKW